MTNVTLDVPDISCSHCKTAIEGAVGELDGVDDVAVVIDARTVDVSFEAPANIDTVVAAIEGQGYEVDAS